MRTITIELPDELATTDFDARMHVAVAFYNNMVLSLGQCAALAGLTKREFIESAGPYGGLKMGPQTVEELRQDIANA